LGHELTVQVPHSILTLMEYIGNYWLTNSWMVKYQSMLCENPCFRLDVIKTLNLATVLQLRGKSVKYSYEILELLKVVWALTWVVLMHCWGHQKWETRAVWGEQKADRKAKQASLTGGHFSLTDSSFVIMPFVWMGSMV
jgi:hypothetical protein